MKLAIGRNELLAAVQTVVGAVGKKSLPVLQFLHVKGNGEKITFTATDLETTLISQAEAQHQAFETLLPAKRLYDVVRAFPVDSVVGLETKDNKTLLKCGKSKFTLATADAGDYPILPEVEYSHRFTIPCNQLYDLICYTDYAIAEQDVRYYLCGILMRISDRLVIAATDGHRLAKIEDDRLEITAPEPFEVIVPSSSITELKKLLKTEGECELCFASNHLLVNLPNNTVFITKLIDGKFPDYERVIPKTAKYAVEFNREELLSAINRVSLIKNDKTSGLEFDFKENQLTIRGKNSSNEEGEEQIDITFDDVHVFGMNGRYMQEALKVMKSATVVVKMNNAADSIRIEGVEDDDSSIHVLMPMRL